MKQIFNAVYVAIFLKFLEALITTQVFCWNAIARCKSLSTRLSIVETADEETLVAAEEIPGLTQDEIDALNIEIDSSMD